MSTPIDNPDVGNNNTLLALLAIRVDLQEKSNNIENDLEENKHLGESLLSTNAPIDDPEQSKNDMPETSKQQDNTSIRQRPSKKNTKITLDIKKRVQLIKTQVYSTSMKVPFVNIIYDWYHSRFSDVERDVHTLSAVETSRRKTLRLRVMQTGVVALTLLTFYFIVLLDQNVFRPESTWYNLNGEDDGTGLSPKRTLRQLVPCEQISKIERATWETYYGEHPECVDVDLIHSTEMVTFENETVKEIFSTKDMYLLSTYFTVKYQVAFSTPRMFLNLTSSHSKPPCVCLLVINDTTREFMINPKLIRDNDDKVAKWKKIRYSSIIIHEERNGNVDTIPDSILVDFQSYNSSATNSQPLSHKQIKFEGIDVIKMLHCMKYMGRQIDVTSTT